MNGLQFWPQTASPFASELNHLFAALLAVSAMVLGLVAWTTVRVQAATRAQAAVTSKRSADAQRAVQEAAAPQKVRTVQGQSQVWQPVVDFVAMHRGLRLLEPRFMEIRQAVGTTRTRAAETVGFLHGFVEDLKGSGFVAEALVCGNVVVAGLLCPARTIALGKTPGGRGRFSGRAGSGRQRSYR